MMITITALAVASLCVFNSFLAERPCGCDSPGLHRKQFRFWTEVLVAASAVAILAAVGGIP